MADGSLMQLIGKCLHVGILDGAQYSEPDTRTVQGSGLSPLLGNIYLHYVLDQWFETVVKPRLRGKVSLIRYADDFVICHRTSQLWSKADISPLRRHPDPQIGAAATSQILRSARRLAARLDVEIRNTPALAAG